MLAYCSVAVVAAFILGYLVASFLVARDKDVVKLAPDDMVVKRPEEGLVLIAVSQQVARRIIMRPESKQETIEARNLY